MVQPSVVRIDSPEEAERILTQVVENIQRTGLSEADEADAYHQLSLIGVSAAAIAKKTGRTKTTVESALKAKSTKTGAAALGKGYTIEEALILAEFFLMWTLRASQSSGPRGVALER